MELNKEMYAFLTSKARQLTEEWYESLDKSDPDGVYASDDPDVIAELKEQNFRFHGYLCNLLISEEEAFYKEFDEWIFEVSRSKEHVNTPIHFIIREFMRVRLQYMKFIDEFSQENEHVDAARVNEWRDKFIKAFDNVILKFTEETYEYQAKMLEAQREMINELSSPVILLKGGTALLPLVGDIDTQRAKFILENTLNQCAKLRVNHLLIDISGVVMIDTMVAYQLFQLIEALNLIGVSSTLSGIRPEIAQTAVQLGLDFESIHTVSTLAQALHF
ncbi:STAS domain-containing protein [Pseudobacillus badius]|uniref:STAS domain-containing protein n=1 Tax=Bacillus badius TaxID=1455 RepID=UPI0007B08973|nr:STAS domain-containing protein [Bacillus badius]KZN99973.1 RsbT co-antagonist protein RsbRB [Bacillus badius]OCS86138.1 RsbT co-antagonist protein RsbRB [Bacillus badius]OVE52401.1 RsbT co-antagonist protein RsbRB [Bacillus badius]TDW04137.1 rsbT co-antagonist protein RsbR [Bacillus badius]UAT30515.1 STAS domain-containing protein [Bacillus badius]